MYCKYTPSPLGLLEICADDDHLTSLEFVDHPRHLAGANPLVDEAAAQLGAYFSGDRDRFDLPLVFRGTDFQVAVWRHLMQIPYGCAVSYQQVAVAVGRPRAVRAVGAANSKNPIAIVVPCHRVIGSDGRLTGYASGLWRKAWLLKHEGCHDVEETRR